MNQPSTPRVKLAGIGLSWSEQVAKQYTDRLIEMGFEAKRVEGVSGAHLVAYSPLAFSADEARRLVADLGV